MSTRSLTFNLCFLIHLKKCLTFSSLIRLRKNLIKRFIPKAARISNLPGSRFDWCNQWRGSHVYEVLFEKLNEIQLPSFSRDFYLYPELMSGLNEEARWDELMATFHISTLPLTLSLSHFPLTLSHFPFHRWDELMATWRVFQGPVSSTCPTEYSQAARQFYFGQTVEEDEVGRLVEMLTDVWLWYVQL